MNGRAPRIAAIVLTAALLGGAAPPVTVSARIDPQRIDAADAAQAAEPAWMRALRIRSEALNRIHGLESGEHRPETRATTPGATHSDPVASAGTPHAAKPASMRALRIRGEALNRVYGLDGSERQQEAQQIRTTP
jgi:hypothetical protein